MRNQTFVITIINVEKKVLRRFKFNVKQRSISFTHEVSGRGSPSHPMNVRPVHLGNGRSSTMGPTIIQENILLLASEFWSLLFP